MIELYDEKGRKLASGYQVPDGGQIKVPLAMMDAAPPDVVAITRAAVADAERPQAGMHRPGSAALTDADRATREQALAARDARLVQRWQQPPAPNAAQIEKTAPTTDADARYAQRIAKLESRWRN